MDALPDICRLALIVELTAENRGSGRLRSGSEVASHKFDSLAA